MALSTVQGLPVPVGEPIPSDGQWWLLLLVLSVNCRLSDCPGRAKSEIWWFLRGSFHSEYSVILWFAMLWNYCSSWPFSACQGPIAVVKPVLLSSGLPSAERYLCLHQGIPWSIPIQKKKICIFVMAHHICLPRHEMEKGSYTQPLSE